jgi:membrane AbrB-like protein
VAGRHWKAALGGLLLAIVAGFVCSWAHTPLPWMIGPLFAVAGARLAGINLTGVAGGRYAGQWIIGSALGLYFTPVVVKQVVSFAPWMVVAGVYALLSGMICGLALARIANVDGRTAFFASIPGGATEMSILAERFGARTDLVAAAHSLRLMVVTVTIPFAMQWSGLHGLEINPPGVREVNPAGLALLALATGVGGLAMRALGRTNPWFMGPLLVAMGFTVAGQSLSAVPSWLSNTAQLVIAVSLGVRFSREFLHTAPRWLGSVALGTVGMLVLCAGAAWLLAGATGLHPATMILGTSPGGIAEMSITAKVLQLGVPVVTAFQVCRLVAVLLIVGPMYRWTER